MDMEPHRALTILLLAAASLGYGQAPTWTVSQLTTANAGSNWACEPSVAVDPKGRGVYVGNILDQVHLNPKGGAPAAWLPPKTLQSSFGVYGDPILAHDHQGRLFYLHLSDPSGNGRSSESWLDRIVIQWSDDQGATWNDGVGIGYNPPKDQDKEGIAIDPVSGTLHVSWTEFDVYGSKDPKQRSRIRYSQSVDRGATWSDALSISRAEGNCLDGDQTPEGAIPVVDPTGGVAVVWSYNDTVWMNRSDDDGALTWLDKDRAVVPQRGGWAQQIPGLGRANGMPISFFAPNGVWHLIYGEQDSTGSWISHSTSRDRGNHWTQGTKLPVADSIRHHFMPWFAIDPSTGSLHVIAYGQTPTQRMYAMAHRSDDEGASWSYQSLSQGFTPTPRRFFGDYNGIAARNGEVHAVWTEQREGQNQIFYGRFADPAADLVLPEVTSKTKRRGR